MRRTFSPYIIKALVDVVTGGGGYDETPPIGVYRSGTGIVNFFSSCGFDMRIGSSSRLTATTEFLQKIFREDDGPAKIERIILQVADPREYLKDPAVAVAVQEHLNIALAPDGLAVATVDGKAQLVELKSGGVVVTSFIEKIEALDFDTVQRDVGRALASAKDDPEDAVTAACSLLEAVCRSILMELGEGLPAKKDIDGLVRAVQEPLNLSPGRTDLPDDIANDIRQILGGITSVSKGVGALRTHAGDAHGREKGYKRIDARIARLAINSASSLALFLIETWELRQHRTLPLRKESA